MGIRCKKITHHLLTTFVCTILAEFGGLTRVGVVKGCLSTEAGGGDCWCRVDEAAAAVNPKDRRAAGKRRKVEENSLKVLLGKSVEKEEMVD